MGETEKASEKEGLTHTKEITRKTMRSGWEKEGVKYVRKGGCL